VKVLFESSFEKDLKKINDQKIFETEKIFINIFRKSNQK